MVRFEVLIGQIIAVLAIFAAVIYKFYYNMRREIREDEKRKKW